MFISREKYNSDNNDSYLKGYNESQSIIRQYARDIARYRLEIKLLKAKLKRSGKSL